MILFSKIMRFCAAQKSIKITLEKKNQQCMSFPCACAFSFQSFNFLKKFDFILKKMKIFSKIMRLCAAQKSMKITLEKKISNACLFRVPLRFHSNLSTLLKTLISFQNMINMNPKNIFIVVCKLKLMPLFYSLCK